MENGSFFGLSVLERLFRSLLPLGAELVAMVLVDAGNQVDVHGPCCQQRPC